MPTAIRLPDRLADLDAGPVGILADKYVDNPIYATTAAAISAAISDAALAGGKAEVSFTPGRTHTINATVPLISGVALHFNKAKVVRAAGFGGSLFRATTALSKVTVQDGDFDNGASNARGFDIANGSSEITFRRNRVSNYTGAFFVCSSGAGLNSHIRVIRNDLYGDTTVQNQDSIEVWNPYDCKVLNNHIEGTGGVIASTSTAAPSTCRHVHVKGNDFRNFKASCILIRTSSATTLEDVVVSGNTAEQIGNVVTQKGLVVVGEAVVTGTPGTTRRATIFGNTIRDYWGTGITCGGGSDGATCEDFEVFGNVMDAAALDGVVDTTRAETAGIRMIGVAGFGVLGNTVRNTARGGIRCLKATNGVVTRRGSIIGNKVGGCVANPNLVAPTPDQEAGILLWDGCQDITIADNTVWNTTTVQNLGAGIGTGLYASITGIRIHDNRCFDDRTPMLQEHGIRIGNSGADASQPSDFIVHDNDVRGNLTAGIRRYETTDHNHQIFNNKGTLVGSAGSTSSDAPIRRAFTAVASLDFPSVAANGQQSLTVTANGASTGDLAVASPDTTLEAGLAWNAWVSAANTVTIRLTNSTAGAIDPAARNWRVKVEHF